MASSTRVERIPRLRIWRATISWRAASKEAGVGAPPLFPWSIWTSLFPCVFRRVKRLVAADAGCANGSAACEDYQIIFRGRHQESCRNVLPWRLLRRPKREPFSAIGQKCIVDRQIAYREAW